MLDALIQRNEHIAGRRKHPTIASTTRSLWRDRLLVLVTQYVVELATFICGPVMATVAVAPIISTTDQFAGGLTLSCNKPTARRRHSYRRIMAQPVVINPDPLAQCNVARFQFGPRHPGRLSRSATVGGILG